MFNTILYSANDDQQGSERQLIFCLHDVAELLETNQIDFKMFCRHLAAQLRYSDQQLQMCIELLSAVDSEERYFNGKI